MADSNTVLFEPLTDFPEFSKFEHKKTSSYQTEATDVSPEYSPKPLTSPKYFKYTDKFELPLSESRFKSLVPTHFLCQICLNVVKDPQECIECENLFCKSCLLMISVCPANCPSHEFKKMAKFAEKIYNSLQLSCKNQSLGCEFVSKIQKVQEHEDTCPYSLQQCDNSLCNKLIIRRSHCEEISPLLCSETCENLIRFSLVIDESKIQKTCELFKELLLRCKNLEEDEVAKEMNENWKRVQECMHQNEMNKKKCERIKKEIEERINSSHPGQWNVRKLKWTCCGDADVSSAGCRRIG